MTVVRHALVQHLARHHCLFNASSRFSRWRLVELQKH